MKTKYILLIFTVLILLIYSFNFVKSYAENKIISFLNSERFNNFIFLRIDDPINPQPIIVIFSNIKLPF